MSHTAAVQTVSGLRRRSFLTGLAGLAVTGAASAACAPQTESASGDGSGSIDVATAAGPLSINGPATKVAVIQFQFLDIMLSLGLQPTMLADDQVKGSATPMPMQFRGKLDDGYISLGTRAAPNLELLASKPLDLILVDKSEHLKDKSQFDDYAPTGVFDTQQWAPFYGNVQAVSTLLGKKKEGAALVDKVKRNLADARGKLGAASGLKALVTVSTPDSMYAFTPNSVQGGVVGELGFDYAYPEKPGVLSEQIPLESIAAAAPDAILVTADAGAASIESTWQSNALWQSIPAVKNNRVLHLDRGVWSLGRGPISIEAMTADVTKGMAA